MVGEVDRYARDREFLDRTMRAAARMGLNELDDNYPSSSERDTVRKAFLDALAWYKTHVEERFLKSEWLISESAPECASTDPAVP